MWNEFKKFAFKGNVIDLAVGVVIGAAFGKIVSSLVKDIITPLLGMVLGGVDFTDLKITFGKSSIMYGNFIQTIFDFLIIAAAIFMFIKVFNKLTSKREEEKEEELPEPTKEEELLGEIRDLLKQQNSSKDRA
ncbi:MULTISPECIES: large-conductance mechanosensitive channel protein MscL [Bacillus]|jgi:large conductance mechanosensitive channel|uniref:Large-conductance mechanosensitive channel n=1 Tax=Bacillus thuringiensis TaxID=1428 RepID=A0A9X7BPW5_BACTU|nr:MULTISPECIES: large-conductance mechanosensitive channel protein MscL [Bacillus]EEL80108.1 Large-conductance mechanosensitive channel [Bacillus cereus AH1271]MBS9801975.1 large-conductance mechanosensitive channel protein MscL [Bacillus toyonensis]AYF08658.1 large conductance mechanosensitive channel protein MscL [Bacillus mobilis]MDA1761544.1 large-conductance mechanosensitive channel protein MscL [Bacillus cereus]MDF9525371.1 large-conductance mechanosensitive channel protein MscL [Bacill